MNEAIRAFGVGCFHFVFEDICNFKGSQDYGQRITELLSNIDSITDIEVDLEDGFQFFGFNPNDDGPSNGPMNPCPSSGTITFNVFLPERVQEKFSPFEQAYPNEKFRVLIYYNHTFPVTFVYPLENISNNHSPSWVVATMREFLEQKCDGVNGLRFMSIGPSPFHADFIIEEGHDKLDVKILHKIGYDEIKLELQKDVDDSLPAILKEIIEPISYFYLSTYMRYAANDFNSVIFFQLQDVLNRLTERNILKSAYSSIRYSNRKDIADIYSNVLRLEQNIIQTRNDYNEFKDKISSSCAAPLLSYVDAAITELPSDAREQISPLLRLTEVFETSGANNWAIVFAALISAVITCMATIEVSLLADKNIQIVSTQSSVQKPVIPRPR